MVVGYYYAFSYLMTYGLPLIGLFAAIQSIFSIVRSKSESMVWMGWLSRIIGILAIIFGGICVFVGVYRLFTFESISMLLRYFSHGILFCAIGWLICARTSTGKISNRRIWISWLQLAVSILAITLSTWYWIQCRTDVANFVKLANERIETLNETEQGIFFVDSKDVITLEMKELARPIPDAHVLTIHEDSAIFEGTVVSTENDSIHLKKSTFADGLIRKRKNFKQLHPNQDFNGILNLVINEKSRWSIVVNAVKIASENEYTRMSFVFRKSGSTPTPPVSSFVDDLLLKENAVHRHPAEKMVVAARYLVHVCEFCAHIWDTQLHGECYCDAFEKMQLMIKEFTSALADCNCMADMKAVTNLTMEMMPFSWCATVQIDVDQGATQGVNEVRLDSDTPWSEAYKEIIRAAEKKQTVRLVAE